MKTKISRTKPIQFLEITIGVICLAIAFHFFFLPSELVTGGVSGLSIIFRKFIDPTIFILCGNIICLILGLIFLGKKFFVKTVYGTLLFPLLIYILELTAPTDLLLGGIESYLSKIIITIALGGFLLSLGLGLCFRNDATTGGIDVIQKILSSKLKIPYSKAVYITDGIIVLIAFFNLKLELTFYGVVAIFIVGYLVDIISMGGKSTRTAYIITKSPIEIKDTIYKNLNRGVTFSNVTGGYSGDEYTMVICTLNKNEAYQLKHLVEEIDEHAFTFIAHTKEVIGDGF